MGVKDLQSELLACLEVLGDAVDAYPEPPEDAELLTALWQTIELVQVLLIEHQYAVSIIDDIVAQTEEKVAAAEQATGLIISNAGDMRRIIKEGK